MRISNVLKETHKYLIIDENDKIVSYIDNQVFKFIRNDDKIAQFITIANFGNDLVGTYYYYDIDKDEFYEGHKLI